MVAEFDNTTILILLIALGILAWGYYRAKPYGKLGLLSWLQSLALMAPWFLFFLLAAAGIYINLISILLLFVASTGIYILLGRQLRAAAKQDGVSQFKTSVDENNSSSPKSLEEGEQAPTQASSPIPPKATATPSAITPIAAEDLKTIQGIFGIDTFFATETVPYQDGAIFKGNLRCDPQEAYTRLSNSLKERIGDRFRLFLVDNPDGKPIVIILPSQNEPQPATTSQKGLAFVLLIATLATLFETGGILLGFDFFTEPLRYQPILPFVLGVVAILAAHEIAHQVMAKRYHVKFSLPFFIPTIQIGSFGAFNRFESFIPTRQALFDVAFAGPAAGGLLSLVFLVIGLILSHPGSLFKVPTDFFQGSVLVGTLARAILGSALHESTVDVNPLTIIGWLGLVITALNLMPAGQLDGGRIMQAIYGRQIAGRSTVATFIVLAIASLANPVALYWAIVILILQRNLERPCLNELSEPDDTRAALGLLVLFLMIATLFPLAPALALRLGIGS